MLSYTKSRKTGKTLIQTLFYFLLTTQICFGQWNQQNSGTTQNLNKVQFVDANTGWAVGDSGLILHTSNGGTNWVQQSSGVNLPLSAIQFIDASTGWVLGRIYEYWWTGEHSILLKTTNGGIDWVQQINDTTIFLDAMFFINRDTGWIAGSNRSNQDSLATISMKTTNGGAQWLPKASPIVSDPVGIGINSLDAFFVNPDTGYIVGGVMAIWTWGTIVQTTDGGDSWNEQWSSNICWKEVAFSDAQNGFAIGQFRQERGGGDLIYRTTNGGVDWQLCGGSMHVEDVHISDSNVVTVVGSYLDLNLWKSFGYILRSEDSGTSWLIQDSTSSHLNGVSFIDNYTGWVVGESGTVLHTTNGGVVPVELTSFTSSANGKEVTLSWSTVTELNNQGFEVQRKFGSNNFVTIGSVKGHGTTTSPSNYTYVDKLTDAGKYFYRLKQIDFDGKYEYSQEVEVNWSPFTTYKLEQNYPNPFNPKTTIGFGIMEKGNVRLSVLNILGEEIKVLLNEEKEVGYHSVDFNASGLPSGVYFYELRAGEFVQTKKMLLLR